MNFRQPYIIALFIYQLSFLADLVVGEGPSKNATGQVSCYVCNSDNEGQKDCESTDLDKLKPFLKPCPVLPDGPLVGRPAESCRKVLQQVEFGKTEINNVVRECGYNNEVLDGKRRAGNSGINLKIWQCINTDVRNFKNFNLINLKKNIFWVCTIAHI
ncbi:unnamed protein product [Meloidogyne enterolobii]|uniref:Uncharacterized protein n=1 Tax=Meloidogyne enterolobii TaxID=390850 RepID=A0ACB1AEE4_MELEN